jgi:hypothetical protein
VHRLIRHRMFAPGRQKSWSQPIRSLGQSAAPSVADRIVGGGQSTRFEFRPSSGADGHRWHGQSVLRPGPPIPGASVLRDLNPHVSEVRVATYVHDRHRAHHGVRDYCWRCAMTGADRIIRWSTWLPYVSSRSAWYAVMTSCTRSLAPSLASSRATCVLAVPTVMCRAAGRGWCPAARHAGHLGVQDALAGPRRALLPSLDVPEDRTRQEPFPGRSQRSRASAR